MKEINFSNEQEVMGKLRARGLLKKALGENYQLFLKKEAAVIKESYTFALNLEKKMKKLME